MTKRITEREYAHARSQYKIGAHGAASEVRKIDVALVDSAGLLEQLGRKAKQWETRAARRVLITSGGPLHVRMSEPLGKVTGFRRFEES